MSHEWPPSVIREFFTISLLKKRYDNVFPQKRCIYPSNSNIVFVYILISQMRLASSTRRLFSITLNNYSPIEQDLTALRNQMLFRSKNLGVR